MDAGRSMRAVGGENSSFCISAGVWAWTRAFGPSVEYGNSNNVECPCFVSGDTGMMAARKIKEATNYNGKNSKWTSKKTSELWVPHRDKEGAPDRAR